MATELSKKQLSAAKRDAHVFINAIKSNMKELMKSLHSSSGWVYKSAQTFYECRDTFAERDTEKNQKRFTRAEESYAFASAEYARSIDKINNNLALIEKEYEKLIETLKAQGDIKGAEATKRELDEYLISLKMMMAKNDRSEGTALPPNESAADGAIRVMPNAAEEVKPSPQSVRSSITSVDIAPMTIDVTHIVESAINSAIERLNEGLTKRIDEYVESLQLVAKPSDEAKSEESVASNDELGAEDQLKSVCAEALGMVSELASLAEALKEIAEKEKEISELQKQINDIQRQTARDQEGVKVNQKLISKEQADVSAEQSTLLEEQKRIAEIQKSISEEQSTIGDTFSDIAQRGRELADKQRALVRESEALGANADKIVAKQSEVYSLQKETLQTSRKLQRDQKQLLGKLSPEGRNGSDN